MKLSLLLLTTLLLGACSGTPLPPTGEEAELRSATPGIVDHSVIPKK